MPGLERIKTGDAEFDKRFCIYADSGKVKQVLRICERITPALRATGSASLDAQGDRLILSSIEMGAGLPRQTFDPQELMRLISAASNLFETLGHQAHELGAKPNHHSPDLREKPRSRVDADVPGCLLGHAANDSVGSLCRGLHSDPPVLFTLRCWPARR